MNEFAALADRLRARGCEWGGAVHHAIETESTNDDARAAAKEGAPAGSVWIADYQTKGRGRQGREWHAPDSENLLFSVLLRPGVLVKKMPPITLAVGVGVLRALSEAIESNELAIKWPNDIVMRDDLRKVAGILVESSVAASIVETLVVGIGINVNQLDFPESIRARATSIANVAGHAFDRSALLASVLAHVETCVKVAFRLGFSALHEEIERADALLGRTTANGSIAGVARGISQGGALIVETPSGLVEIGSGEIDVR